MAAGPDIKFVESFMLYLALFTFCRIHCMKGVTKKKGKKKKKRKNNSKRLQGEEESTSICTTIFEFCSWKHQDVNFYCWLQFSGSMLTECFVYLMFLNARILSVPVVHRMDYADGDKVESRLFGHPNILYLPSHMTGEFLYESVDRVVTYLSSYTVILTDGQVSKARDSLALLQCLNFNYVLREHLGLWGGGETIWNTVKLIYKDHPIDQQNVFFIHKWSLYTGSITWKVYPWGSVKCGRCKQVVFRAGLTMLLVGRDRIVGSLKYVPSIWNIILHWPWWFSSVHAIFKIHSRSHL